MGALTDQDQSDVNQLTMAGAAQSRTPDADPQGGALAQAAAYGSADNRATDDQGNAGAYSPQDMRTLQLLDNVRGQLAPKHTGATLLEGYGQAAENQYKTLSGVLAANAKARAAMALQTSKGSTAQNVAGIGAQSREDVAHINAGSHLWQDMEPGDLADRGYPPGTVAQINQRGQVRVVSQPPANQRMLTGYDDQGRAKYADPGEALAPAVRTAHQDYIRKAQPVMSQMDEGDPKSLWSQLNDPASSSALGGPGGMERATQGMMGMMGQDTSVAPKDLALRTQISQFNQQAAAMLHADPRNQSLSPKAMKELEDDLPNPDSIFESRASALEKIKRFKENMSQRLEDSNSALKGNAPNTGAKASPGAADNASDASIALQHAKDAIAAGADPDKVKARINKLGIDPKGL